MENATKALLIAAAILIAILLISLGIAVMTQGQETINKADMSEAEMAQFNGKFTGYEGTHVSTANVTAMLRTVLTHNQTEAKAGTNRFVTVYKGDSASKTTWQDSSANSIKPITGSYYYTVTVVQTGGIVNEIYFKQNS